MCKEVEMFIHTSVSDAQVSLNNILQSDPGKAQKIAKSALEKIEGREGQASREKMLKTIIRKSQKVKQPCNQ